jgi:predicted nucleic acid-binding protein
MVKALLDTNIIVDLLRKHTVAEKWLTTVNQSDLSLTRIVWLEVIEGASSQIEQNRALKLLNDFEIVELTVSDVEWATRQFIKYRLSHQIEAFDCLIAGPSYRLRLPLYTRNVQDFTPLLGTLAQQPY